MSKCTRLSPHPRHEDCRGVEGFGLVPVCGYQQDAKERGEECSCVEAWGGCEGPTEWIKEERVDQGGEMKCQRKPNHKGRCWMYCNGWWYSWKKDH